MKTGHNRHDKVIDRFKKETILKWMASLTVTVVVTATIVITTSKEEPIVSFNRVSAVGTTIVYDAQIVDPGLTITEESLTLRISSSLEAFTIPLKLGQNFGTQEMRYLSSEYTLSIQGSQGFGVKTFVQEVITTNLELSGAITGYQVQDGENQETLNYDVDVLIYNKDNQLSQMWLRYGYIETSWHEQSGEAPSFFETINLTSPSQQVELLNIPNYNYTVILYLEGLNLAQETIVLDHLKFTTPPYIDGSFYIQDIGFDFVALNYFISTTNLDEQSAIIELYHESKLIDWSILDLTAQEIQPYYLEEQSFVVFDHLMAVTDYTLKMTTSYRNQAGVMETQLLYEEVFSTTAFYEVAASVDVTQQEVNINLVITDSAQMINQLTFTVYEPTEDYPLYLDSGGFDIVGVNNATTTYTASFLLPSVAHFYIEITADKLINDVTYYGTILYTLSV